MAKKINQGLIVLVAAALIFLLVAPHFLVADSVDEDDGFVLDLDQDYYGQYRGQNKQVIVYNWGEYISDGSDGTMNINQEFTKATGIEVTYLTFSTNEELYAKLKSGNAGYDVIIPSDYMIGKMMTEEMLTPLDHSKLPNLVQIDPSFVQSDYDPGSTYSVPYTWGMTGIIYNTQSLKAGDVVDSWDILWDEDYKDEILMFSNSRDAFGISQNRLGYSLNTTDPRELEDSLRELKKQKPLVQAYVMDEIFDKMIGGEATLAPYYAGDAITMMEDNPNLGFAIPKEGANIFVDGAAIPKTAPNPDVAHLYLNFLMEPAVAAANADYIGYATPNMGAKALLEEKDLINPIAYPPEEQMDKAEYFLNLPRETNLLMDSYWTELLSDDQSYNMLLVPILLGLALLITVGINLLRGYRKKTKHYF